MDIHSTHTHTHTHTQRFTNWPVNNENDEYESMKIQYFSSSIYIP